MALLTRQAKNLVKFPFVEFKNPNAPVLVLIAGFPDNVLSGWDSQFLAALKLKFHIIALCLPDYDQEKETIPWGLGFEDLIDALDRTLNSLPPTQQSFYLVAHDWGSVIAQLYENKHPGRIKKLVLLDVGGGADTSIKGLFIAVTYQLGFAINYFFSNIFGQVVGNISFRLFRGFIARFMSPVPYDSITRPITEIRVHLCYPIFYLWKSIFSLSPIVFKIRFPSCPVLFLYGTKKNCMFHNKAFLAKLASKKDCRYLSLDAGHWITHFQPDICYQEIVAFCTKEQV